MLILTLALLLAACAPGGETGAVDGRTDGGACVPDSGTQMWRGEVLGTFPVVQVEVADYTVTAPDGWTIVEGELRVYCGSAEGTRVSVLWL